MRSKIQPDLTSAIAARSALKLLHSNIFYSDFLLILQHVNERTDYKAIACRTATPQPHRVKTPATPHREERLQPLNHTVWEDHNPSTLPYGKAATPQPCRVGRPQPLNHTV